MRAFALDGISGGNAVFNPEKLDWFNQQHIALLRAGRAGAAAGTARSEPPACGTTRTSATGTPGSSAVLELLKPRAKRLDDFVAQGRFFFTNAIEYDPARSTKHLRVDGMREHLAALEAAFAGLEHFDAGLDRSGAAGHADAAWGEGGAA